MGISRREPLGGQLLCRRDRQRSSSPLKVFDVLGRAGIESLVSQPPTLEEFFLRHYEAA